MRITLEETFKNVLSIKWWNFKGRSFSRYLLAAALISLALNEFQLNVDTLRIFLIGFCILLILSLCVIFLSAALRTRKKRRLILEIDQKGLTVIHSLSAKPLFLGWDRVRVKEDGQSYYISDLNQKRYFYWIEKSRLSPEELQELQGLIRRGTASS